jgi:aminoglycoside 6'-N-acetyltransferase
MISQMQAVVPGTPGQWCQIGIELLSTHELIGDCAFCIEESDSTHAHIGYTLARAWWGHGYAAEAVSCLLDSLFDGYGVHEVTAICDELNMASMRLARSLGMEVDELMPEPVPFKGRMCREYHFHIQRERWHNRT